MPDPSPNPELSPLLKEAVALLQSGQILPAINLCQSRLEKAREVNPNSLESLDRTRDLAWILWWSGDADRSLENFQQAMELAYKICLPPDAFNNGLQYSMLLAQSGRIEEAAIALESRLLSLPIGKFPKLEAQGKYLIAKLNLYQGNLKKAEDAIEQALTNMGHGKNTEFYMSWAMLGEIRKALSPIQKAFLGFQSSFEDVAKLAEAVSDRILEGDPVFLLEVVTDLLDLCNQVDNVQTIKQLNSEKANLLGLSGRHSERIKVVLDLRDSQNQSQAGWVEASLGLALAYSEAMQLGPALKEYKNTLEVLSHGQFPKLLFQARFQCGLLLDQMGKATEAIALFRQAANDAYSQNDLVGALRVRGAMGIVRIHQNQVEEGLADLRHSIEGLPPEDPYSTQARLHWEWHMENKQCQCFNPIAQKANKIRAGILSEIPHGLARGLKMTWDGNKFHYEFDFARVPNQEQELMIQQTITQAEAGFFSEDPKH